MALIKTHLEYFSSLLHHVQHIVTLFTLHPSQYSQLYQGHHKKISFEINLAATVVGNTVLLLYFYSYTLLFADRKWNPCSIRNPHTYTVQAFP